MKKRKWILTVLSFLMGGVCGWVGIESIFMIVPESEMNAVNFFKSLILLLVILYVSVFLHTFIHETGHMVFGLLTGYKFSSIRFLSLMFIKDDEGKIRLKKFKIAGTGGQCLMLPPEMKDGYYPSSLYNMGGCIFNLVAGCFAVCIYFLLDDGIVSIIFFIFGIVGIFTSLMNGIPIREISNDGYNTVLLRKNKTALKVIWIELNIVEMQSKGVPMLEMPKEWFEYMVGITDFDNNINISAYVNSISYYIEKRDFEKVNEMCIYAEENIKGMISLHEGMIKAEHIFALLVTEIDKDKVDELANNKKIFELIKTQLSMLRVWYAYYLIYKVDKDKAEEYLKKFEKCVKTYPYRAEVESERKLIQYADSVAGREGETV